MTLVLPGILLTAYMPQRLSTSPLSSYLPLIPATRSCPSLQSQTQCIVCDGAAVDGDGMITCSECNGALHRSCDQNSVEAMRVSHVT